MPYSICNLNPISGGGDSSIRYNEEEHAIEIYSNGEWYTVFRNIYPGAYNGCILYNVKHTSPYTKKIIYVKFAIENDTLAYAQTDYVEEKDYSGGAWPSASKSGYGIEVGKEIASSGNNAIFWPSDGSHWVGLTTSASNVDSDIISKALPQTYSTMTAGTGAQVSTSSSEGKIIAVIINY